MAVPSRIRRINSINNMGVFKNYTRHGDIRDFNDKNIIYGWNYCGKTTLSRVLNLLNSGVPLDEEYSGMRFEIELEDGTKITNVNRQTASPCLVRVFNADYITNNLRFTSNDNKIKAIAFDLGEETRPIRDKIALLKQRIENYAAISESTNYFTKKFNQLDSIFTDQARTIKNACFNSTIEFTKTHLKRVIEEFSHDTYRSAIIFNPAELSDCQLKALEKDAKPVIDDTCPNLLFDDILSEVKRILLLSPRHSSQDEVLSTNQDLYDWGKSGLNLHKQHNLSKCAFCGQDLTSNRIEYLNEFYSNEAAKVKEAADNLFLLVEKEKRLEQISKWFSLNEFSFSGDYGTIFKHLIEEYEAVSKNYQSLLEQLMMAVQDKINNNLFVPIILPNIDISAKTCIESWITEVVNVIKRHNESVRNFSQIKTQAITKYKKHLVASFLDQIDYYAILDQYQRELNFHNLISSLITPITQQIEILEAQVKSIAKGKEVCNKYIQLLLHRDDIKIETTDDGYFVLKRGDRMAKNLSEGEKSDIAFAYFLVYLESDIDRIKESIIVIDDPISSLDANHIAQVSSLINSFFFKKDDETNPEKVCNCFLQLFVLTHNFEFYNFIRDANNIKRKKKITEADGRKKEVPALHEFFIKRVSQSESTICNMPKSLSSYKSEYVYLWQQIVDYKNNGCPEASNYIIPNIVRRFLEIYTLIKLPGNHDEIDNRVKILIGDVNELKILHTFSHFTSLDRVAQHSELAMRMPDIIDDVFALVQKDDAHYKSLNEAIGN